jgi:hypothetical protein
MNDRINPAGAATRCEVERLSLALGQLWPVEEAPHFDQLLRAIDDADLGLRRSESRRQ